MFLVSAMLGCSLCRTIVTARYRLQAGQWVLVYGLLMSNCHANGTPAAFHFFSFALSTSIIHMADNNGIYMQLWVVVLIVSSAM